ncbi:hypothetical protein V8C86DRAFT_2582774 [Haematococcus lacustris]
MLYPAVLSFWLPVQCLCFIALLLSNATPACPDATHHCVTADESHELEVGSVASLPPATPLAAPAATTNMSASCWWHHALPCRLWIYCKAVSEGCEAQHHLVKGTSQHQGACPMHLQPLEPNHGHHEMCTCCYLPLLWMGMGTWWHG